MRTYGLGWWKKALAAGLLTGGLATISFAQTGLFPVVTIRATDPLASWSGDPGTFTLFRDGPTNNTLSVFYLIGGSASNGVDYATIPSITPIPAGERTATITINPINNGQSNLTKTVFLQLSQPPWVPPVNFVIGNPSNATVYIVGASVTNIPPTVRIAIPTNGQSFTAPANIEICALAADPDGYVATVEFFNGTNSLGIRTNNPVSAGPANPFCLLWPGVGIGDYTLTAVATDNGGATTKSDPIKISVVQGPPPTNIPPMVRITSPPNGAIIPGPANVPLFAYAKDPDGTVVSVEFFDGTNSLGFGQSPCIGLPSPTAVCPSNSFMLIWSNAPLGGHVLTAQATDNGGATGVSDPVKITIVAPRPPPTNRPPIVSIAAVDPIAIEGTNCWVWPGVTNTTPCWSNWWGATCRSFTNCGPKNATFAVRRFGETNDDLTVSYRIGGTASNGVDYVTLPGVVTIPAGQLRAPITVTPIDDGTPDISATVILKLQPGTNYMVGFPAAAAALIIDSGSPRPATCVLADRCFHVGGLGPDAAWFDVQFSTDMSSWTTLGTFQVIGGSIDFVDPDAQTSASRFYRAVPDNNPVPF